MPSLEVSGPLQVIRPYTLKWNVELLPNGKGGALGVNVNRESQKGEVVAGRSLRLSLSNSGPARKEPGGSSIRRAS